MAISADELAPIIATISIMAIPLVAILTSHQRKMALIIHGSQQNQTQNAAQNDAIVSEVRELKQVMHQQAIALDNLTNEVRRTSPHQATPDTLTNRLG